MNRGKNLVKCSVSYSLVHYNLDALDEHITVMDWSSSFKRMFSNTGSVVDSIIVSKEVFKVQALEMNGAEELVWAGSSSWF